MIYAFDLDNTLVKTSNTSYKDCQPIIERIKIVNDLYDAGHKIVIYTARGSVSGLTDELIELTTKQLELFGIKNHELVIGKKIHFDILIDDKAFNADSWFKENEKIKQGIIAGSFDVIHPGYIKMFKDAKNICTKLIVLLHKDPSLERTNKTKPILTVGERVDVLLSIKYIDNVLVYDNEDELEKLLIKHTPHIRILGSDYKNKKFTGDQILGNEIYYHNRNNHIWSTTLYKQKIAESLVFK